MYCYTTGQTTRATTISSSSFFSLLTVVFAIVVVTPVTAQSSSNDNDDYVATTLSNVAYDNIFGWEAASDLVAWEKLNVEKWSELADCSPDTTTPSICSDCGLGVIVVEFDEIDNVANDDENDHDNNNTTQHVDFTTDTGVQYAFSYRTYMIGNGGNTSPHDYNTKSFEIASFTKAITALAMEVMIDEGTVTEDMTIAEYLPDCDWEASASSSGEIGTITFEELRLHTSGLPAQPPNRGATGTPDGNPFGGYSIEMLCDSLLKISNLPTRGRYSYSNYAYGMLGYVLARAEADANGIAFEDAASYEDLVREKVLNPMGMHDTVVKFEPETAAVACSRGDKRDTQTIRLGEYDVLQGNGALRSTLPDIGKFMEYLMISSYTSKDQVTDAIQQNLYNALHEIKELGGIEDACTCVSGWCEGWLCSLPSGEGLEVTKLGVELYTSGGVEYFKKSGDTGGYSSRGAWSTETRRGAYAIDTCGGCGEVGTHGSGAQRLAMILASGPPDQSSLSSSSSSSSDDVEVDYDGLIFKGEARSQAFPSPTLINIEVRKDNVDNDDKEQPYTVYIASSDGMGCSSKAKVIDGGLQLENSALYGCGWGAGDPLVTIPQSYKLLLLGDGSGASFQTQGYDIYLTMDNSSTSSDASNSDADDGDGVMNDDCDSILDAVCGMKDTETMCDIMNVLVAGEDEGFFTSAKNYTIFVPNDDAFKSVEDALENVSEEELGRIILFHMYEDVTLSYDDLVCSEKLTSMDGDLSRTKCENKNDENVKYQSGSGNTKHGSMPEIMAPLNKKDRRSSSACNAALHSVDHLMLPVHLQQFNKEGSSSSSADDGAAAGRRRLGTMIRRRQK